MSTEADEASSPSAARGRSNAVGKTGSRISSLQNSQEIQEQSNATNDKKPIYLLLINRLSNL